MAMYDKQPVVPITDDPSECRQGWTAVLDGLRERLAQPGLARPGRALVAVELYPGIDGRAVADRLREGFPGASIVLTEDVYLSPEALRATFAATLTEDPVFNVMHPWTIEAYFDPERLHTLRTALARKQALTFLVGPGAAAIAGEDADLLVSGNVARWELQRRQRAHRSGNLGFGNADASPGELYKIAFFLDWRVGDRCRHAIYRRADLFLDLNDEAMPRMLPGAVLREAVRSTVERPFRVVPFFDPGPWGGQWMRSRFALPEGPANYAWGFDCVPEENSVLLGFGERRFELPAIVLVQEEPERLLGETVLRRFGAEFPIRFDLLDTVEGGNLSLQVHPSTAYIREHFGMPYTQDESYYMLHSEPGSSMVLGLREQVDPAAMAAALTAAERENTPFDADRFVTSWPTQTHDHFSIPAGTVHCSGVGNVVLEISATPYIFTFKLWDWGRTGLDGRPRPIHLKHGLANIRWERTTTWVERELVGQTASLAGGEGWREERTGLHSSEFLETRRHWFTATVPHETAGNLQVLNLVEGEAVVIASPTAAFPELRLHYAETVILPACLGAYTVSPASPAEKPLATLKAFVRE